MAGARRQDSQAVFATAGGIAGTWLSARSRRWAVAAALPNGALRAEREGGLWSPSRESMRGGYLSRPDAVPLKGIVNSCVCGLRWSSFLAPATAGSLRSQMMSPRVMSDS